MKKKCLRKLMAFCLALIMLGSIGLTAAADGGESAAALAWETDIRLSNTGAETLMREAGYDLAAWDRAVEERRQAGLAAAISREALLEADENALILEEDGRVYQLGASALFGQVQDALDAWELAYRLVEMLGCQKQTWLCLRSRLTANDETIYTFSQIFRGEAAKGAALKIAVDGKGGVTAVFSSLDPEAGGDQTVMTRAEAEALAASRCAENGQPSAVREEYTRRVFHLMESFADLSLEADPEPVIPQYVWVVFTENGDNETAERYPWLAHYIKVDGEYLYSLPVADPCGTDAGFGYRQQDVFDGMEADTYTGTVTDVFGSESAVTIPVMYCPADGCWYLGDVERRIVFADFSEAVYGENHELKLIKSEDNLDWDSADVFTFYNYLRARDFYADMGWDGPDGRGTDVVVFRNMRYANGMIFENACSIGQIECWQGFGYSAYGNTGEPTNLTLGLDVMAHEFTHSFTGEVMGQNLYENDCGAINEAMSDILGNLAEYLCRATEDEKWLLGENTGRAIRSMTDPTAFGQPAYVWDLYYGPRTDKPLASNDSGGVHGNSSLLNQIAAGLCLEYGMRWEDAMCLWTMTAMGQTPRADFPQLRGLLTWAMRETGLADRYQDALDELIDWTRIDTTDFPEAIPEGRQLVRLVLPDTEAFQSKNWTLIAAQSEQKTREQLAADLIASLTEAMDTPEGRQYLAESLRYMATMLEELDREETGPEETGPEETVSEEIDLEETGPEETDDGEQEALPDPLAEAYAMAQARAREMLYGPSVEFISWEEMDSGVIPLMIEDKPTQYVLANIQGGGSRLEKCLALAGGRWYDLTDFMNGTETPPSAETKEYILAAWRELLQNSLAGTEEDTQPVQIVTLPTAGLEDIVLNTTEE